MISEKEKKFMAYWEASRQKESTFLSKLLRGLPMAMIFSLPIILMVIVVMIFFPEWYMKMSGTSPGTFVTAIIAMLIVTIFYSFFRMHYKWEMNEQLYQELKAKEKKEAAKS
ncbi:MAG: hypothetical protein V4556_08090 [Bacteroidota bacterium]